MKTISLIAILAIFAIAIMCVPALKAQDLRPDPRQLSIYQIVVGSFNHSDASDAPGYTDMWGPKGHRKNGNIKGITERLDYIKDLGMNAIWITPVFDSAPRSAGMEEGFGGEKLQATGYFCTDYFSIDPKFGSTDEFRELVDEAHKRGIYIILDGVFGHHGDEVPPSPEGNLVYGNTQPVESEYPVAPGFGVDNVRGDRSGNIKYPESLPYFKEVVRYWIDNFGVDGWRFDQCYQVYQDGHNYWREIRREVDRVASDRLDRGEKWGILGYLVGEDWAGPDGITTTRQDGLRSVFDFDARDRLNSLPNGVGSILFTYQPPTARGYQNDSVMPNLFLSNHDVSRVADNVDDIGGLMLRHAVLAAYSGPVTIYYGDEWGDISGDGNPDNMARTSAHFTTDNPDAQELHDFVAAVFNTRQANPAMWRGSYRFREAEGVLEVTKTDADTGNQVVVIFPLADTDWTLAEAGTDLITGCPVDREVKLTANRPMFVKTR